MTVDDFNTQRGDLIGFSNDQDCNSIAVDLLESAPTVLYISPPITTVGTSEPLSSQPAYRAVFSVAVSVNTRKCNAVR